MSRFFRYFICSLSILTLMLQLTACAPAENPADASAAWDGTDADTIEVSGERLIRAYSEQCEINSNEQDLIKEFGTDTSYTRTLPSGEVQIYVETEVTRTERTCDHIMPAGDWDGTDADSVEVSEERYIDSYSVPCLVAQIPDAQDFITILGITYTYTRTLPSGEVQEFIKYVPTREERNCSNLQDTTWDGTDAEIIHDEEIYNGGYYIDCQADINERDIVRQYAKVRVYSRRRDAQPVNDDNPMEIYVETLDTYEVLECPRGCSAIPQA